MKKYTILQTIMLSFYERGEQRDYLIKRDDGFTLLCDGSTIWIEKGVDRHESITMANAVPLWIGQGKIQEISPRQT